MEEKVYALSANIFERDQKRDQELERLKKERNELFQQIGLLKVENDW
ncbi:MAG: hypothetical protein RBR10_12610 [Bacteroidales bacterium]|jgi:cell division protein FtsB|nr:hypothetical protein [Bacteroidales bacterium]MDY0370673.1 hypothetical protein [Bacteroidales bacterium]